MPDDLKPCPFCGKFDRIDSNAVNFKLRWISCSRCKFDGPKAETLSGAITAWNRRPDKEEGAYWKKWPDGSETLEKKPSLEEYICKHGKDKNCPECYSDWIMYKRF